MVSDMSIKELISEQRRDLPLLIDKENCSGKVFIVTGANIGIGLETSRHLVHAAAARVIMGIRNARAGVDALADIEETTGRHGVAEVWPLDLASYESVKLFAQRAMTELSRIDCVIENAAAALENWSLAEGMETSTTVNVFSTFLLGILLLPKLIESGSRFQVQPRLVFVVAALGFYRQKELERFRGDVFGGMADKSRADMVARFAFLA
jgi:NAD(P)-dependent dehydrogenase (short-subunit alcohol dehydrogenase family)